MDALRKVLIVFAVSATALPAVGPVGRYLGIAVNKCSRTTAAEYDSVHVFFPTPYDTVWTHSAVETTVIAREFTIGSNPAYLRVSMYHGTDTNYVDADTAWEEAATFLKVKDEFVDTFWVMTAYKIPFSIGSAWTMGIAGTYYIDLDGDGQDDTFRVWNDTARVIGQENVRVPYGLIRDAYKIQQHLMAYVGMTTGGIPVRDTIDMTTIQWYKDSLWSAKDSVYQTERIYIYYANQWLHYANAFKIRVVELTNLWVGIEEEAALALLRNVKVGPNPFRRRLVINGPDLPDRSQLVIYDASGRLVEERKFSKNTVWQPKGLPAGVYYLTVKTAKNQTVNLGHVVYLK